MNASSEKGFHPIFCYIPGVLSLVLLSTKEAIFLFDVLALGEKFIFDSESPLRNILEDSGVMKVLHDSRIICDLLHHKYQVTLSNVYDTLAAHTVFGTYAIYAGYMPKHTFPFTDLVSFFYIIFYILIRLYIQLEPILSFEL